MDAICSTHKSGKMFLEGCGC